MWRWHPRLARLGLVLCACFGAQACAAATESTPPDVAAKAWLLVDYHTATKLASHKADVPFPPAGLTKLMTAYVLFQRLRAGELKLRDTVNVSPRAWRMKGARLFLQPNDLAAVGDLVKALIVHSANDATVALVEHVAGREEAFVAEMNKQAQAMGMLHTHFVNATGVDQSGQYSTALDLSILAGALIRDFPEFYKWFSLKEFSYRRIKHYNRNALLWRDEAVDGVKTAWMRSDGYRVIASAHHGEMRLIATVIGAEDDAGRTRAAQRLLDYGFRNFETRRLYSAKVPAARVRVWMGKENVLPLGVPEDLYLTLPRGSHAKVRARLSVEEMQFAPIEYGRRVGTLSLDIDERPYAQYPLVALKEIRAGNVLQRAVDRIELWLQCLQDTKPC